MVALGEHRDGIHFCGLEGRNELLGVEGSSDVRNVLGGVEVEMDLAVAQWLVGRSHTHSLEPEVPIEPPAN